MKRLHLGMTLAAGLAFSGAAGATLIDRGGGLIYDDVLDITWLQDANLGAGSAFDDGFSTTDGRMTWQSAVAWADALVFGGFDDWRLPTLSPIDGTTFNRAFSNNATTDRGTARTTTDGSDGGWRDGAGNPVSELGHMFYVNLGNLGFCTPNDAAPGSCVAQSGFGLANVGPILNLRRSGYWFGLELAPDPSAAWSFVFGGGAQGAVGKATELFAWAVRPGDVVAQGVPEPGTVALLGAGLGLLGLRGRARRRRSVIRSFG